jgi:spore germination protein KC
MRKLIKVSFILFLCLFVTTGCWDGRELNDLGIVLGWGMDLNKDGTYLASAQLAIPAKLSGGSGGGSGGAGSSPGQGYYLETATGRNNTDAGQNIQLKLSRKIFPSHRRVIVLGEKLAENGLLNIIDEYSRNPEVRMRTDIFVVKGGTAKEFLSLPYTLENIPAIAAIKIHESVGGTESTTFKQFLEEAHAEGGNPSLPMIGIVPSSTGGTSGQGQLKKTFRISGRAIFNEKLKMIGSLTDNEARLRFWVRGQLKTFTLTVQVPEGKGNISFAGRKYSGKIQPMLQGGKVKFFITLIGKGTIKENNTNLDLKDEVNNKAIERALNQNVRKQVTQMISRVQKKYKTDVFGFGEAVHRKYPKEWKKIKVNWNRTFSEADIAVNVNVKVEQVGSTGPALQLKEREIKK